MPKISVILPTYHRPDLLKTALISILNQNFTDYEILVLDDYGKDNTKQVVKNFEDKRIVYIKNKQNLGYGKNLMKGFDLAKSEYIFLLGDDDIILNENSFSLIYGEMTKHDAGYAQLGYIFYGTTPFRPSSYHTVSENNIYLKPNKEIIINTTEWHFGSISGSIFRKSLYNKDDIINDVWFPYYKLIYKSILKKGCINFGELFILAKISTMGLISYVDTEKNKGFYMNKLFEIFREFDTSLIRYNKFLKNRLDFLISTLPGIKYYTSNQNIVSMAKEILRHRPEYMRSLLFWRTFLLAYGCPKVVLDLARRIRLFILEYRMKNFVKKISLDEHLSNIIREA